MSSPDTPAPSAPSPLVMRLALVGSAVLLAVAGGTFYLASQNARPQTAGSPDLAVTVTASACEPNALTTTAGRPTIAVHNASERALEWEILDGVMVVAERENIAPGITATLSPRLSAGTYAVTCGLLSNPRGTLTVLPSGNEATAGPDIAAFVGPLAEMQVYLMTGAAAFADAASALEHAVGSGDLDAARAAYLEASAAYARVEPAARRFADLGEAIEANAVYFSGREADPAFGGLHRIEYGLFTQGTVDGLAPVARKLATDAAALAPRLAARVPEPSMLTGDATDWLAEESRALAGDGRDIYAGNDLADLDAGLATVRRSIDLATPLAGKSAAAEAAAVDAAWTALQSGLAALKAPGGYPSFADVPAGSRQSLSTQLAALADALDALRDRLMASAS